VTLDDRYLAIRHFAHRGLVRLCERAARANPALSRSLVPPPFDELADAGPREQAVAASWAWWRALDKRGIPRPGEAVPLDSDWMPVSSRLAAIRATTDTTIIAIGGTNDSNGRPASQWQARRRSSRKPGAVMHRSARVERFHRQLGMVHRRSAGPRCSCGCRSGSSPSCCAIKLGGYLLIRSAASS
jgi:hypothetical protein